MGTGQQGVMAFNNVTMFLDRARHTPAHPHLCLLTVLLYMTIFWIYNLSTLDHMHLFYKLPSGAFDYALSPCLCFQVCTKILCRGQQGLCASVVKRSTNRCTPASPHMCGHCSLCPPQTREEWAHVSWQWCPALPISNPAPMWLNWNSSWTHLFSWFTTILIQGSHYRIILSLASFLNQYPIIYFWWLGFAGTKFQLLCFWRVVGLPNGNWMVAVNW